MAIKKEIEYIIDDNNCHICTSHKDSVMKYPQINRESKRWRLSRFIYTREKGEIPKGMVIRHMCDNPLCINPDHLIIGTQKDNVREIYDRGRNSNRNGELNPVSKLKESDVLFIKHSDIPRKNLANQFNVSKSTIDMIKNKKRWKVLLDQDGD